MTRYIVYFTSEDKKVLLNQFHTSAKDSKEAVVNLHKLAKFKCREIGVREYQNDGFINNKFY